VCVVLIESERFFKGKEIRLICIYVRLYSVHHIVFEDLQSMRKRFTLGTAHSSQSTTLTGGGEGGE